MISIKELCHGDFEGVLSKLFENCEKPFMPREQNVCIAQKGRLISKQFLLDTTAELENVGQFFRVAIHFHPVGITFS